MHFVSSIFKGIALGAGAILPGISSGVLCVIFGIYEKLLDSILYFFRDIKNNLKFLLPIFIGVFVGVLIFSNFLQYFLLEFPIQSNSIFIGLILGTIPTLLNTLNNEESSSELINKKYDKKIRNLKNITKLKYFFTFLICFSIGVGSVLLENFFSATNIESIENTNFLYLMLSGFLMSVGIVVPRC